MPAQLNTNRFRRIGLRIERLEERAMMTAVPAMSSLPGAPQTLYLDFNGDYQPSWDRTDEGQHYANVSTGEYNTDLKTGFSASELADINQIWQEVADDYSPFNINVTTVEPAAAAFTTNQAMRVVIATGATGQVLYPHYEGALFTLYTNISGNSFITNNYNTPTTNSGYAAGSSFTNAQPNVAFVFAPFAGNPHAIATTASHEAGHTFGLSHHSVKNAAGKVTNDYDAGDALTTPIMGNCLMPDRTIWSITPAPGSQDSVGILRALLGARPDDHANTYLGAKTLAPVRVNGSVYNPTTTGVISSIADSDYFRIGMTGGLFTIDVTPTARGNLDAKLEIYKRDVSAGNITGLTLIASADPSLTNPFTGVGASLTLMIESGGEYYARVASHGEYGDLGMYSISVVSAYYPVARSVSLSPAPEPGTVKMGSTGASLPSGGGVSLGGPTARATSKVADLAFASLGAPIENVLLKGGRKATTMHEVVESLAFSQINRFTAHVVADLAFAAG